MIADAERSVALAGIMGGEETEIGESTTEVLLEAANFEPTTIFRTSERLRLRTEGSNRWEKGVDPYLAEPAARLATRLLVETAGARWVGDTDVHERLPERPVIRYRPERADELIGIPTPPEEQIGWLERVGFEHRGEEVVTPTWRARDVTREVDVIEEVARKRLEDVPFTLPARREMFGALTPLQRLRRRVEDVLAGLGLTETYTPSLRPDDPDPNAWQLPEPISTELAVLRTRVLPSLVDAARRNVELGADGIALFEIARAYLPGGELPDEHVHLAAIVDGGWSRAKGIVETLYAALKAEPAFERDERRPAPPRQGRDRRLGPRRRAAPVRVGRRLGRLRARSREAPRGGSRGSALRRRRQLPRGSPGSRVRRARGGERRRARRGRTRGGRARAAGDAAVRRLPRRAGRAWAASPSPSRSASSQRNAR